MNTSDYNPKIIEHFTHPRNVGEIKGADGVGQAGNPTCGDQMKLTIKVGKNKKGEDVLDDVKFLTYGCAAAIATSSATTEMAKGRTVDEAYRITREDVAKELGGLPEIKMHCSNLASDALKKAIEDYRSKTN